MKVANLKELRQAVKAATGVRVLQADIAKRANLTAADVCRIEGGRKVETFRQDQVLAAYRELCGVELTWAQVEELQQGVVLEIEMKAVAA